MCGAKSLRVCLTCALRSLAPPVCSYGLFLPRSNDGSCWIGEAEMLLKYNLTNNDVRTAASLTHARIYIYINDVYRDLYSHARTGDRTFSSSSGCRPISCGR